MYGAGQDLIARLLDESMVSCYHCTENPGFGGINPEPIPPYIENEIDSTSSNISISLTQNLIDNLELVKTSVALEKTKLSSAIVDVNGLSENIEDLSSNPNIDLAINSLNDAKRSDERFCI